MKRLGRTSRRIVLTLHMSFAATWLGGVIGLLLLSVVHRAPVSADVLVAIRSSMKLLDYVVIIPSCFGSLITGGLFMWRTSWGFTKHYWVILKWIATLSMILFGTFFLGPWVDMTAALSEQLGLRALGDARYGSGAGLVEVFSGLQIALLLGLIALTSFKPWGRRGDRRRR